MKIFNRPKIRSDGVFRKIALSQMFLKCDLRLHNKTPPYNIFAVIPQEYCTKSVCISCLLYTSIIIVVLLAIAIVLGIIAFRPVPEPNLVPINPVSTPEVVDIEIIPTPSPEPPAPTFEALPEETPIVEEVTESVEESYTPSKKKDTNAAFFLVINDEKVNIARGVDESTLKKTPGWLESSAEPGEEGVCVVYGLSLIHI